MCHHRIRSPAASAHSPMEIPFLSSLFLIVAAPFVGSFLGTLVTRLPEKRPLVVARSRCEHCRRTLGWRDLVPIVSWLAARGRCRHCGASIGAVYPAIELAALAIARWSAAGAPAWSAWAG